MKLQDFELKLKMHTWVNCMSEWVQLILEWEEANSTVVCWLSPRLGLYARSTCILLYGGVCFVQWQC